MGKSIACAVGPQAKSSTSGTDRLLTQSVSPSRRGLYNYPTVPRARGTTSVRSGVSHFATRTAESSVLTMTKQRQHTSLVGLNSHFRLHKLSFLFSFLVTDPGPTVPPQSAAASQAGPSHRTLPSPFSFGAASTPRHGDGVRAERSDLPDYATLGVPHFFFLNICNGVHARFLCGCDSDGTHLTRQAHHITPQSVRRGPHTHRPI